MPRASRRSPSGERDFASAAPTLTGRSPARALSDLGFLGLLDALRTWAIRVVGARLEWPVPAAPLDQRLAADRAGLVQHLRALAHLAVLSDVGPVLALGVARARDEGPVSAGPLHELPFPALRALLTGRLGLGLRRIALDVLAVGITGAADELSVSTGALLQRLAEQLRLRHLAVRGHRAAKLAFRVARAAHERTESACLQD